MRGLSLLLSACGLAAAVLGWRLTMGLVPPADPATSSMAVRLGMAVAFLLPASLLLAATIAVQMAARFVAGAFDPTRDADTAFLRRNQRVISNSVEQLCVFAPALLALAAGAGRPEMPAVEALAIVFAAARLVFWAGYLVAPMARAPGMAASFGANLSALLAGIWMWLK